LLVATGAALTRFRPRSYKMVLGSGNITMIVFMAILLTQKGILMRPDILGATVAIIGMFATLFSAYDREEGLSQLFHMGMLLGIASILVGQSILMIPGVFFALLVLRTWNWREWVVPVLGVLMVVVFVFLVLIWTEHPLLEFQRLVQTSWISLLSTPKASIGHIFLFIPLLISVPSAANSIASGSVAERNFSLSLLSWILASILCVIVLGLSWQNGVVFAAFPFSVFIAKSLESINKWWLADLLLIAVLLAPFLSIL